MSGARVWLIAAAFLCCAIVVRTGTTTESVRLRTPLHLFPLEMDGWRGEPLSAFDARTLALLGADDYTNRIYVSATGVPLGFYIGYYESQRDGDTIHSPLNCLPGAGWEPVDHRRVRLMVPAAIDSNADRPIQANRYLVQKGHDRQLVYYWYQSHQRIVASEYAGKVFTVIDAIRLNRTDAALVRVVVPLRDASPESEAAAEQAGTSFIRTIFPHLGRFLPA